MRWRHACSRACRCGGGAVSRAERQPLATLANDLPGTVFGQSCPTMEMSAPGWKRAEETYPKRT